MNQESRTTSSLPNLLARNTIYNLLTQSFLVIVALWCIPLMVRGLSEEGFGLLMLVWVLVASFSLLDFGVSRANTKFLAESLAVREDRQVRRIVWTSLTMGIVLGVLGAVILLLIAPYLVKYVFRIGYGMEPQALEAFRVAAIAKLVSVGVGCIFITAKTVSSVSFSFSKFLGKSILVVGLSSLLVWTLRDMNLIVVAISLFLSLVVLSLTLHLFNKTEILALRQVVWQG